MTNIWLNQVQTYEPEEILPVVTNLLEISELKSKLKPGMKVLLKPNLLAGRKPAEAVTTHPIILEGIIAVLQKWGVQLKIFDSPGGPFTKWFLKDVYEKTGMTDLAQKTGVELNWDTQDVVIDNPKGKYVKQLTVAKAVTEADFIINLPKFKTHGLAILTGAVKNMFGCVPGLKKPEYHLRFLELEQFAEALVDIAIAFPRTFCLMDAVVGMEGAGPSWGELRKIGLLIAGYDPFIVDVAMAKVINLDINNIPILNAANQRGLLPAWSNMQIHGGDIQKAVINNWKLPMTAEKTNTLGNMFPPKIRQWIEKMFRPNPWIVKQKCTGCTECVKNCPAKCMQINKRKVKVNLDNCIRCFCCQELCPNQAVKIKRLWLTRWIFKL